MEIGLKNKYTVGLVVPLMEEFEYLKAIAPIKERYSHMGTYFYELDFGAVAVISCIVNDMGPVPAIQATERLLNSTSLSLVVVLGLAGALDHDVLLGDVVVAKEINEYLANAKAVETNHGFEFKFSGRHHSLLYSLSEAVSHFRIAGDTPLEQWRNLTEADVEYANGDNSKPMNHTHAKLHLGPIASGDVVGSSQAFTNQLRGINRKFLAIDMEAAGVVQASTERYNPVPVIVMRGISDFADSRKSKFDAHKGGKWRKLAVRNVGTFLKCLLTWPDFQSCIGLKNDVEVDSSCENMKGISEKLCKRVGGAWLFGVIYDLYSHAPLRLEGDRTVATPLSIARNSDENLNKMMATVESALAKEKESFTDEIGCNQIEQALGEYIETLSPGEKQMLSQFDQVVLSIIDNHSEEQQQDLSRIISEIESLIDEESYDEAEVRIAALDPTRREVCSVKVELLFSLGRHSEIVELLETSDCLQLSRGELENYIVSCYELQKSVVAIELIGIHKSRFKDSSAKLFRTNIISRYPSY